MSGWVALTADVWHRFISVEKVNKHAYKIIARTQNPNLFMFSSECASFRCFEVYFYLLKNRVSVFPLRFLP